MGKEKHYRRMRRPWTPDEDDLLRELYPKPEMFAGKIADILDRGVSSIYERAKILGLKKPPESKILQGKLWSQSEKSMATRFKKGNAPANRGYKMSAETYEKAKATMFKKGHRPLNHKEVGSERVNVDGYIEIKIAEPSVWVFKHRYVWEQHNGAIPQGYLIAFKDKNKQNCDIDNLYITSRADHLVNENSMTARYPQEMIDVIRLRATLKRQITNYNKKHNQDTDRHE